MQLDSYVNMKYPNAVASVYAHDGLIHMFIVNNRYAPNKFMYVLHVLYPAL